MKRKEIIWNNIIADFHLSELTMKDYCEKYGYNYATLGYHKRRQNYKGNQNYK